MWINRGKFKWKIDVKMIGMRSDEPSDQPSFETSDEPSFEPSLKRPRWWEADRDAIRRSFRPAFVQDFRRAFVRGFRLAFFRAFIKEAATMGGRSGCDPMSLQTSLRSLILNLILTGQNGMPFYDTISVCRIILWHIWCALFFVEKQLSQ